MLDSNSVFYHFAMDYRIECSISLYPRICKKNGDTMTAKKAKKEEIEMKEEETDQEEEDDDDETEIPDLEIWAEDLRAKWIELEDQEFLTPKEQAIFNEKLMEFLEAIIVNMRIMKEQLKMIENVYKIKDIGALLDKMMKAQEGNDQERKKHEDKNKSIYA